MNNENKLFHVFLSLLLGLLSSHSWADNLVVKLNKELPALVSHNINNYLGELPQTSDERTLFIFNAKTKTLKSLQALGYYRPDIFIETFEKPLIEPWLLNINVALNQPTIINSSNITISGDAQTHEEFIKFVEQRRIHQGENLNHGS